MPVRYGASIILLAAIVSLFANVAPSGACNHTVEGVVRKVIDEDTVVVVTREGTKLLIRLYGIDGPEIRRGNKPGQPYGEESKDALKSMILGKKVCIDIVERDRYKRMVGVIYLGDINVNEEMVREGWAWAYGEYHRGQTITDFIHAERQAKENKRGLWRQADPLPPWEHRRRYR